MSTTMIHHRTDDDAPSIVLSPVAGQGGKFWTFDIESGGDKFNLILRTAEDQPDEPARKLIATLRAACDAAEAEMVEAETVDLPTDDECRAFLDGAGQAGDCEAVTICAIALGIDPTHYETSDIDPASWTQASARAEVAEMMAQAKAAQS